MIDGLIGSGILSDIAIDVILFELIKYKIQKFILIKKKKDTAFNTGCLPYNLELPTSPTTTPAPVTTPNPCGSDYKCENQSPLFCIKPEQVNLKYLFID